MKQKWTILLFAISIFVCFLMSCHKSKSSIAESKIIQIVDSGYNVTSTPRSSTTTYTFSYNSSGSLDKIVQSSTDASGKLYSDSNKFVYLPGEIIDSSSPSGYPIAETLYINSAGDIYRFILGGIDDTLQYNGNEIISNPVSTFFDSYIWSDNNVAKIYSRVSRSYDTGYNTYYTDRVFETGDYFQINEFITYGRSITHNKNLLRSTYYQSNKTTDDITYTFDSKNRINACILTEASGYYYQKFTITYDN